MGGLLSCVDMYRGVSVCVNWLVCECVYECEGSCKCVWICGWVSMCVA